MAGAQCCENPPSLNPSSGVGHVEQIGGLNSYVSGSSSHLAVILVPDVFGYEAPLLRKFADKLAATGYYVVVPDFFNGDAYNPGNVEKPFQVWLKDHGPEKGCESIILVIEALKQNGISKIGAVGYCWGAKVVAKVAQEDGLIQAGVFLHPSFVTVDDIKCVKVPLSFLGAETDHCYPPEVVKQFEEILNAKPEVDSFIKIFPGVSHGWSVRYDPQDDKAVKAAEEAYQDTLAWLQKHIN